MNESERFGKWIVVAALFGLLGSVYLITNIDVLFLKKKKINESHSIGQISYQSEDVRHRSSSELVWKQAEDQNSIFWNDSVFTGESSQAKVDLKNGTKVKLRQNSLVTFKKKRKGNLVNFSKGLFDIHLAGETEIEMNGERLKLSGRGAQLQVRVDKKTGLSKLKVVHGQVKLTNKKGSQTLKQSEVFDVVEKKLDSPHLSKVQSQIEYTYKLYDIYKKENQELIIKKRKTMNLHVPMSWNAISGADYYKVALAQYPVVLAQYPSASHNSDNRKSKIYSKKKVKGISTKIKIQKPGLYHAQVKAKKLGKPKLASLWSVTKKFMVSAGFLKENLQLMSERGLASTSDSKIPILKDKYPLRLSWTSNFDFPNYIVESSGSSLFLPEETKITWVNRSAVNFNLKQPREYYFRVRGVSKDLNLSPYSNIYSVTLFKPLKLAAPIIENKNLSKLSFDLKTRKPFRWSKPMGAKKYLFEVFDANNKKVSEELVSYNQKKWRSQKAGSYRLRVTGVDQFGRYGKPSQLKPFSVERELKPKQVVAESKNQKKSSKKERKKKKQKRKVASKSKNNRKDTSNQVRSKISQKTKSYNQNYKSTQLQLEGASLGLLSSTNQRNDEAFALAMAFTLRGFYWWNSKHGAEGAFKSKALGYNDAGNEISPMSVEARYHYRWNMAVSWISFLKEFQMSVFSGLEYYRNSGTSDFINSYNLLKMGMAFRFPLWKKWDTGGEFAYGLGVRGMNKKELQGYVNYYIKPRWALGIGYRLNYLEVGDVSDSPEGTLPYGEAYGEAFGNLKYSF